MYFSPGVLATAISIGIGFDVHGAKRAEANGEKRRECDQHQRTPRQAR